MKNNRENEFLDKFLNYLQANMPMYIKSINIAKKKYPKTFHELGSLLTLWASKYLSNTANFEEILGSGYAFFVNEVNRSQIHYETQKTYYNKSYQNVFDSVYNNPECMLKYHWGVYVTTFLWVHHLQIFKYFRDEFLPLLLSSHKKALLELGSGSGVWGLLSLTYLNNWNITGVDISSTSIGIASAMAELNGFRARVNYVLEDALKYRTSKPYGAGLSCFLMEHLEKPALLLKNLSNSIEEHGWVFITAALTAAEVDHIFEFKKESELVKLSEESGFRVVSYVSASPNNYPLHMNYLPRSMAMILQKRKNEIW